MQKVTIIGVGRLGGALAVALSKKGFRIENLIVRNDRTAERISGRLAPPPAISTLDKSAPIASDVIIIATQDFEIEGAAKKLAGKLGNSRPFVFHTSGALSSDVLEPLRAAGCPVGSIHPLVSLSDAVIGAERFADAFFCVEGEREAVRAAAGIVEKLGGKSFSIETKYKPLYHASAVTACGHLVALVDVALEMLGKCGLTETAARETLFPLIKSTVDNLKTQTPAAALTGTFARADVSTFEKHLAALERDVSAEAREIYLQLGARSTHLAERQGANAENLREIQAKISLAKKNFKC